MSGNLADQLFSLTSTTLKAKAVDERQLTMNPEAYKNGLCWNYYDFMSTAYSSNMFTNTKKWKHVHYKQENTNDGL